MPGLISHANSRETWAVENSKADGLVAALARVDERRPPRAIDYVDVKMFVFAEGTHNSL